MLGKLCKYEFKSIGRTLLPIYVAVIAVSVIASISLSINIGQNAEYVYGYGYGIGYQLYNIFRTVMSFVYGGLVVALFVLTAVIILQRFYKGLLCDEGYLMFALPVKTWQLITAKGIAAFVMSIVSGIVSMITIFIVMLGASAQPLALITEMFSFDNWSRIITGLNMSVPMWPLYAIEFIVLCIVGGLAGLYQIYASMAIGHLAKKHRVMVSIAAYIAISTILSFVGGFFGVILANSMTYRAMYMDGVQAANFGLQFVLIFSIVMSVIQFVVFFFATERILSKKLNLE